MFSLFILCTLSDNTMCDMGPSQQSIEIGFGVRCVISSDFCVQFAWTIDKHLQISQPEKET